MILAEPRSGFGLNELSTASQLPVMVGKDDIRPAKGWLQGRSDKAYRCRVSTGILT